MQLQPSMAHEVMFPVGMLHMTYSQSTSSEGNVALEAATKSTRILEDMLSQDLVQHGSLHFLQPQRITHIFSALCIHTIHFGRVGGTSKKLAEHRAKLCLLGLKELQKLGDLENWVLGSSLTAWMIVQRKISASSIMNYRDLLFPARLQKDHRFPIRWPFPSLTVL
ncbi:hypothetical protein ASPNIDRAFT_36438 [Aspergillus niger ATCC 1015]|uniref:Uncharacterized protein n=1 Tax=Aspergillus niger (strain ATCC 1015 / CBS 113.46 / FGSC A1144 / LSHB Ac4 / NCTC 3858a / NRRL 328 / USDA 3528.7) TaxID=380704 RepID=G3XQJ0_ASPNA|nr:hypothetical protein ASPNIDRAFT_36438 [Aspergillus niger ATCC 1015]